MKSLLITVLTVLASTYVQAQSTGSLLVEGEGGRFQIFQKVKAVRCSTQARGQCDTPVFFDLNKPFNLPEGQYIVGFENSIHPGLVAVRSGATTRLRLERLTIPSSFSGQKVKVYRDLSQSVEQNKILMSMYYMNRHFFRLEKETFGDLYLTGAWERDFVQRFTYEACSSISSWSQEEEKAKNVCNAYKTATQPSGLRELYTFNQDGTMVENWVTIPGALFLSKHPRYLVATPMRDTDFVAVFAGAYKVEATDKSGSAVSLRAGSY